MNTVTPTPADNVTAGHAGRMQIMSITYSHAQFTALRSLAAAYGHGWVEAVPATHPIEGCLWTRALISELYAATARRDRLEPWQYGIAAPEAPGCSGVVCHTTGSGRLTWQVSDDGAIGIVISRPAPDRGETMRGVVVLSALVRGGEIDDIRSPDKQDGRIPDVYTASWSSDDGPRAEVRHGDELLRALSAVVDCAVAIAALEGAGVQFTWVRARREALALRELGAPHSLLDLTVAGRVLEACSGFRDAGASAALWETVAPDLLGQPIADISEYARTQLAAGGPDADAWDGVASALARSSRTTSPRGSTARGLHEVVEVIGDVTAVVATARAVATPIAALVRRALDRRRQRAQSGDVQIEVDLPPAAAPVGLADRVSR